MVLTGTLPSESVCLFALDSNTQIHQPEIVFPFVLGTLICTVNWKISHVLKNAIQSTKLMHKIKPELASLSVQIKPQTHLKTATQMPWPEDVYLDVPHSVTPTKTSLITHVKIPAHKVSLPHKFYRHVWQYVLTQLSLVMIQTNVSVVVHLILGGIQQPKPAWMDATMADNLLIILPTCV